MEIQGRQRAPFTNRVWKEIEAAVEGVKQTSCTARSILHVDGPWGTGLTALSGDDQWLEPTEAGADFGRWGVPRGGTPQPGSDPDRLGRRGTFLVQSHARPVPLITSEFILGARNLEAFDDDCQPLDITRASRAARDVALEEERLIYYGNPGARQSGLLTHHSNRLALRHLLLTQPRHAPQVDSEDLEPGFTDVDRGDLRRALDHYELQVALEEGFLQAGRDARNRLVGQFSPNFSYVNMYPGGAQTLLRDAARAVNALGSRGFGGPYAMILYPTAYTALFSVVVGEILLADLLGKLFTMGVHMSPSISPAPYPGGLGRVVPPPNPDPADPALPAPDEVIGVIVTCSRSYARLVVGQDWTISYRGSTGAGVFHRFTISSSVRLELTEPAAIQVLHQER